LIVLRFADIPHPGRCEFYFVCNEGTAHFRTCAPGLIFDAFNGWCDVEENSICAIDKTTTTVEVTTTEEITTTTTEEVTTTTTPPPDPNDFPADVCSGIFLSNIAHPNSILCNFYIVCFMEQPTLEQCEPGTIFSANTQVCEIGNVDTCTFGMNL
jgi:hypothetical protein